MNTQLTINFFNVPIKPIPIQPASYKHPNFKPIIGQKVSYEKGGTFEVQSFSDWCVYFVGGHWCTDNVFMDLLTH